MANVLLITIRCAHQSYKDMNFEIQLDWTVENLKSFLKDVYPSKPDVKKQRLIYAGQLMKDSERLTKYFNRHDPIDHLPIVHLVCAPAMEQLRTGANNGGVRQRRVAPAVQQMQQNDVASSSTQNAPPPINSTPQTEFQQAYHYPLNYVPAAQQPMTFDPAWQQSQQLYNAYMMQYMQYLQQMYGAVYWPSAIGGSVTFDTVAAPPTMGQPSQSAPGAPVVQNADLQQQQPNNVQLPQAAPQAAMNAQGGADDEDDPRNRDWLDWLYMGCRAMLLFTILYFYSSMERFTFVMLCCLLIYGLQAGWFGRRRGNNEQQQQQQNNNNNNNEVPAAAAENAANEQAPNNADPMANFGAANAPPEEPQTAWNVFWSTCWTFVSSFFASLVPQRPPPMNIN